MSELCPKCLQAPASMTHICLPSAGPTVKTGEAMPVRPRDVCAHCGVSRARLAALENVAEKAAWSVHALRNGGLPIKLTELEQALFALSPDRTENG